MANEGYEHGVDWVQIDDDSGALGPLLNAALPPATVRASTLCYSRTGGRWWGCIVSNPATSARAWVLIGAGGGGGGDPDILFVVARDAKYGVMAATVFTTLQAALIDPAVLAAAAAGGASLLLLDDVYDVSAAPQTVASNLRLFAFSAGGAIITSSAAGPTLLTLGNAKFENVSVGNTGGSPAIRTTGNGTIDITGACEITGAIDAATNNNALDLKLSGRVIVLGVVVGGAAALVVQTEDCFVGSVVGTAGSIQSHGGRYNLVSYTAAANITANDTTFGPLDTAGSVTLQSCSIDALGAVTPPSSLTMRECQADGAVTADSATVRGSTITGALPPGQLDIQRSSANGGVVSVGKCEVRFSSISGGMNSSSGAFDSFQNLFNGSVSADGISDTGSEFRGTYTSTTAPSTLTGSYLYNVITLGAGQGAELRNCFVRVPLAGFGNGAIVNAGGTVDLIDCYVRADDTFLSVSGTGNVSTTGHVAGGCRFETSGGLVVLATTSGVRARSVLGIDAPIAVTADDTIDALTGTAEVIDSVYLTPDANGWTVQAYPASAFPMGYRHFIKNISGLFGVSIAPFGALDTIDGLNAGGGGAVTIGPNDFVEMEKVSNTGWQTCS